MRKSLHWRRPMYDEGGGGGGGLVQFFLPGTVFVCATPISCRKNCNPPPRMIQKVVTLPTLKDTIGIIKRDQALHCSVHNRKRVALLPDLIQVATREELS